MTTLNNKIIELKQQNILTNVIDIKGEYSVDITDDVTLADGDQVIMRNCFLDTSGSSSNQIKIDKDTDLTLTFCPYMMHLFDTTAITANNTIDPWDLVDDSSGVSKGFPPLVPFDTGNNVTKATGLPLFRTKVIGNTGGQEAYLHQLSVGFDLKKFGKTNQTWGNGPSLTVKYFDFNNDEKFFHFNIPKITIDWSKKDPQSIFTINNLHIPCIKDSFRADTSQTILDSNKAFFFQFIGGQSLSFSYNDDVTKPKYYRQMDENSIKITIKEGLYNPSELANIITTELQTSNQGEFVSPSGLLGVNSCLVNAKNMLSATTTNNIYAYASSGYEFSGVAAGGYAPLAYAMQSQGYWAGASQVALEFDEGANKFYWTYLHTPAYSSNGELNVSIQAKVYEPEHISPANRQPAGRITIPNTTIYEKKAGGIALMSLQPADFWSGQLGFNLGDLCITPNYIYMGLGLFNDGSIAPNIDQTTGFPDVNMLVEGITATAPRIINDVNISKTADFNKSGNVTSGQPINTTEIYANNQVLQASITNAYWYVDVDSNFNNNIIGNQDTYKSTVGIVSNYYNSNSYTSGSSVDSIIYTHKGQDQQLSSFKVTILDSDRNKSELLGDDNTVFLEIVKNKSQVEQIMEQEKAVEEVKQMMKK